MAGQTDAPEPVELLWEIQGKGRGGLRDLWPKAAAFIAPGRSKAATARHVGVHPSTVAKWCKDQGFLALVRDAQIEWTAQAVKAEVKRSLKDDSGQMAAGGSGRKRHESVEPMKIGHRMPKRKAE